MKPILCALALLPLAFGCQSNDGTEPTASSNPSNTTQPQGLNTSTPQGPGSTSSPTATATTTTTPSPSVNTTVSDDNLKRTYQLKDLKKIALKVGKVTIQAWIMDDANKREEGMMYLGDREVKPNEGMLFVFSQPHALAFWMKNTLIPLDIMFVGEDKKIINIEPAKALDETGVHAARPAMYVIEMKLGSAKRLGIKPGDHVAVPADVKSLDDGQ